MRHTTYAYATRERYTGLREGFEALMRKKDASLAGGAYARTAAPGVTAFCPAAQRSRWAASGGTPAPSAPLGMGILQGILAALTGAIQAFSWDGDGLHGRATIQGIGSAETYQMSFDDTRPDYRLFGGFVNGAAYQATLLGLVVMWAQWETQSARTAEVLDRWWQLVAALDTLFPRSDRHAGWDVGQVKAACQETPANAPFRAALEQLADALFFALRYALPERNERGLYVQYDPCVSGTTGTALSAPGSALLTLPCDREPVPVATPAEPETLPRGGAAGEEDADDVDHDLDLQADDEGAAAREEETGPTPSVDTPPSEATSSASTAPTPPAATPTPVKARRPRRTAADVPVGPPPVVVVAPPSAVPPVPRLIGSAMEARIARAFTRPGDVFLFGVTATGKTTWAKQAAIGHGFGLEIVVFKPGLKDEMLYGSLVQRDGGWCWEDGPIVRAARRAVAGEPVVLLLDELPRGDKSIVAGTMELMNVYAAADLTAQALPIPDAPGPYRVVRVVDTQETLVVPAGRLKIVATANLGDRYQGMDLSDPAFRRRWAGGWIELGGYTDAETAAILAGHLGLPASHALIQALIRVDRDVQAYQRKEEALVMTTNLATLIVWGQEVIRQAAGSRSVGLVPRPRIKETYVTAAQDLWIDMLCPLSGDRRDPEVYRAILTIVERHAPDVL